MVLHVGVGAYEPGLLADVRAAFGDPDAVYIMEKSVGSGRD